MIVVVQINDSKLESLAAAQMLINDYESSFIHKNVKFVQMKFDESTLVELFIGTEENSENLEVCANGFATWQTKYINGNISTGIKIISSK